MNAAAAVAAPNVAVKATAILDLDSFASILEASQITEKTDLGAAVLFKAQHPEHGNIILVNTAGAHSAVMYV